ncbi:MAG: NADH-quinone oxidoreductase subunit M, partial [Flavobacteriales bacterium]|nr:NADH-quinone oxidoreductase subunit M [Flavobacteriales bacterium]
MTFVPFIGGIAVMLMPKAMARWGAFAISVATFALSLMLWTGFDRTNAGLQFEQRAKWIDTFGVHYHVGVDGLSVLLVLLTTFLMPMVILGSFTYIKKHIRAYMGLVLMLQAFMTGAFISLDIFLFYVFWELMLIPIYLIVGIWGGQNRIYAAIKLFVYTMVGSLLMLGAILYLYYLHNEQFGTWSAYIHDLYKVSIPLGAQSWMFACFALAFAIKMPMWPLHTWLPDAHTEAPTGGSMVLAGILLKMGTYGFIRLAMPLFPEAALAHAPLIMGLSVIGIIVGALVAMVQTDVKKLVAYSSVSHLGFVSLGLFTFNVQGTNGAMMQMINHG